MLFDALGMTRDDKELKSCPMIDNSRNDYCAEFKRILNLLRFDTHAVTCEFKLFFFVCISYRWAKFTCVDFLRVTLSNAYSLNEFRFL